jgi:hypothetical protein
MGAVRRDEQEPHVFHVDWPALHAGRNPWKREPKVAVDPFLVAKAVKAVMRLCPHKTATGAPLVWNDYAVFLDLGDWERVKKLEGTLVRDLGGVVEKELKHIKAAMVGSLAVRLLRDEGGTVRPGNAIIKVDFSEGDKPQPTDPSEMTVRIGIPVARSLTDLTQRVPEAAVAPATEEEQLKVSWPGGSTTIRAGSRVVMGRPHTAPSPGFVALAGAGSKINKRQVWIEAGAGGAIIGRLSEANPVEVMGRLVQSGGQIAIDSFPAEVSLSNGELCLTVDRIGPA